MTATWDDLSRWFDAGVAQGATHMIVGHDPYDNENYPVYVAPQQDVHKEADTLLRTGNRIDEVYALWMDKAAQFAERRAFHY